MMNSILSTLTAILLVAMASPSLLACPGSEKSCGKKHTCSGAAKSDEAGGYACGGKSEHKNHKHGKSSGPVGMTAEVSAKIDAQTLAVKVAPPEGAHLNYDGPWKLELAKEAPIATEAGKSNVFGADAFNKESGQFEVKLAKTLNAGEKIGYKVTYFLCADDKSWCKRLQYEGQAGN